ncbi:MAG: hypothetical protein ACJA2S_003263 [Cyclobacteriaceae bacterium]|jgi:hypothetical protein
MEMTDKKQCPQCGKKISGRLDKKFCDAYCRNSFNNLNKSVDELMIKDSNRQLRLNRRILKSLCPEGKATIRKEVLANLSFDFTTFTGMYPTAGKVYYLCYDYAYTPIMERETIRKVLIVQKQGYMDSFDQGSTLKRLQNPEENWIYPSSIIKTLSCLPKGR